MKTKNTPTQTRKLNMEEKRKVEKLLIADIDTAIANHRAARSIGYGNAEKEANERVPAAAKAILAQINKAEAEMTRAKSRLSELGYSVRTNYNAPNSLRVDYSNKPKLLRDFDDETARVEKSLAALKRTYTIKLFAGGEEAQELFGSLARELTDIVR